MIRVVTLGINVENNFGSPSILKGVNNLLSILYEDFEHINYQNTQYSAISIKDMDFQIIKIPTTTKQLLLGAIKKRFGIKIQNKDLEELFNNIKQADVVVDLDGILFCDHLVDYKYSKVGIYKYILSKFPLIIIAKTYGKKVVKNTCSFGPMKKKINYKCAKICCEHLFDIVSAREEKSREVLINYSKVNKSILLSPDIANLMKCKSGQSIEQKPIGISVSFRIVKQWKSTENYYDCIVSLVQHIKSTTEHNVVLIPNELSENGKFDDMYVAKEIQKLLLEKQISVKLVQANNITSTELKCVIANCELVVASRYHACVAALSSGVPTLVVGWHYKYEELLKWYGQNKWILSSQECSSKKIIDMFDLLWDQRYYEKKVIEKKYYEVEKAIIETGKIIFSK